MYVMRHTSRYCACTTSSHVACEQRMLNGQTTVDSIGLMHTRCTLSRSVLGLVVQSGGSITNIYVDSRVMQSQVYNDILALCQVFESQQDDIFTFTFASFCYHGSIQFGQPTQNVLYNTKSIEHALQKKV